MSRDGFDINDFRDSDWEPGAERESYGFQSSGLRREINGRRGTNSSYSSTKLRLQQLRDAEVKSDRTLSPDCERQDVSRAATSPDFRNADILRNQARTKFPDRDRVYSLRASEICTLIDVGRFRVVAVEDLANLGYAGDRPGMESDLPNLVRQGFLQRRSTSPLKEESQHVLTLTKQGQRFLRRHDLVPEDQTIYSGLVKPKEANHDASLYRLYQKAAAEIEGNGGKVLRVQLDYELKEKLYKKLGKAQTQNEGRNHRSKVAFARELHLPVVNGKVTFPDVRIEYANQEMEFSRVDLELATGHYHAGHLSEKARAGFQIYARSEDAAGLRRVRDEREIMTAILSL